MFLYAENALFHFRQTRNIVILSLSRESKDMIDCGEFFEKYGLFQGYFVCNIIALTMKCFDNQSNPSLETNE